MFRLNPQEDHMPSPSSSIPQGHMTEEEARAVIALWSKNKAVSDAAVTPRVSDVADALDISPQEAQRLLDSVRTQQAVAAFSLRRRRRFRLAGAALILIGFGYFSTCDFAPDSPTLTVEGVQTRTLSPQKRREMVLDIADTRTDVVLQYHPHSLLRFLLGPNFSAPSSMFETPDSLTDQKGNQYAYFPVLGGGQEGIVRGWLHRVGFNTYSVGYAFPMAQLPPSARQVTLHASVMADGQTMPIDVPVNSP